MTEHSSTPGPTTPWRTWLVPLVVVAAVVAAALVLTGRHGAGPDGAAAPAAVGTAEGPAARVVDPRETAPDLSRREEGDPLAVGEVDAPVAMVVYSDYQCPFCAAWATETQPTMMDYVERGELRIEYRDIAVFGEDSRRGAVAAYAAGRQGAYREFHDALFADGDKASATELAEDALVELAGDLGLDTERFAADLRAPEVHDAVGRNIDEAQDVGAFSTPAFLVNGEPVLGALPTEHFVQVVDDALTRAG